MTGAALRADASNGAAPARQARLERSPPTSRGQHRGEPASRAWRRDRDGHRRRHPDVGVASPMAPGQDEPPIKQLATDDVAASATPSDPVANSVSATPTSETSS